MSHYPGHNPHSSHSGNQGKYLWDQVKVQIPNPNGSTKLWRAYIFSPVYYTDSGAQPNGPGTSVTGAYRLTRPEWGDTVHYNAERKGLVYLFAQSKHNSPDPADADSNYAFPWGLDNNQPKMHFGHQDNRGWNYGGDPLNMWGRGMPMEGVFPEVGDIVKITDLDIHPLERGQRWFESTMPWHGRGGPCSSGYPSWLAATNNSVCAPPLPATGSGGGYNGWPHYWPYKDDKICLQVIRVINEAQFNSSNIFKPMSHYPILGGPVSLWPSDHQCNQNKHPYTNPVPSIGIDEGCHFHDRPWFTGATGNVTYESTGGNYAGGGISPLNFYMKPNPDWTSNNPHAWINVATWNMPIWGSQPISIQQGGFQYHVDVSRLPDDNSIPNMSAQGTGSIEYMNWTPKLTTEAGVGQTWSGPPDSCNIHKPAQSYNTVTEGYQVPYTGRYTVYYGAEVYQNQGGTLGSPKGIVTAWITINGKVLSKSGGQPVYNNPYTNSFGWGGAAPSQTFTTDAGIAYLPNVPPYNATNIYGYCCYWHADDNTGHYTTDDLKFEINLQKEDKVQVHIRGKNTSFWYSDTVRIRRQYFGVHPTNNGIWNNNGDPNNVGYTTHSNTAPPPGSLCFDENCDPLTGWEGTTTIFPSSHTNPTTNPNSDFLTTEKQCRECLEMPSWNCDLSQAHMPVVTGGDSGHEWWRIEGKGCIDPGDGTGEFWSFSGITHGPVWQPTPPGNTYYNTWPPGTTYPSARFNSCVEQCNPPWWECDGNGSCISYTTVAPLNAYTTLAVCQSNCVAPSWNCDNLIAGGVSGGAGVCYDPGTGNGQFTSLNLCQQQCSTVSWDCLNGVCMTHLTGGIGQYSTLATCQANCFINSWDCINGSCIDPNDGTGAFPLLSTCKDICSSSVPCNTYFTVSDTGTLNVSTDIKQKKLYYYDATVNSTTYILDLPLNTLPAVPTPTQKIDDAIANTDTKLWAWGYDVNATTKTTIVEYDIITPTSVIYNRTIEGEPIEGLNVGSLSAINNKTLIALSGGTGLATQATVIEVDIHPVLGPTITEKFLVDKDDEGDTLFWKQQGVLFTTSNQPAPTGKINKYDYGTGTLINSVNVTANDRIRGLAMSNGSLYGFMENPNTGGGDVEKYLINKQTLVQTYITDVNTLTPYPIADYLGYQGRVEDSSTSPCCDDNTSNCSGCLESISQYMVHPTTGGQIPINFIAYDPTLVYVTIGDCLSDPGGCCKCCTYDSASAPSLLNLPNNCTSRLYAKTLSYVAGESKTKESTTHLEEIKRWFVNPENKAQDTVWNTKFFAKRNQRYEKEKEDNFEAISLFSLTINMDGKLHTFDDNSTWSDVIKYSISLGAPVDSSMTWDKYISKMYGSFNDNKFSYSVSDNSCGYYSTEKLGPQATNKSLACQLIDGEYIDNYGTWRDCEVDIYGEPCTGDTLNWGCCGPTFLGATHVPYLCDNRQSICPSGCAKVDTGYVGADTESFFKWYANVSNGFYATDIKIIKYLLNTRTNQYPHECYEPGLGWWYNFRYNFTYFTPSGPTGPVVAHLNSTGVANFSTWLEFLTALFSNGFVTINLGLTFTQLLNYPYDLLINKLKLLQPNFSMAILSDPCKCDPMECVQNVPKPDGYLTKEGCQNSSLNITDCPYSDQRCTPDPWVCEKRMVPSQSTIPQYKCFCVQKQPTTLAQDSYATEDICKNAKDNCCLPETYNCKTSESDCVGKDLLPHIVGMWWNGAQATNTITSTPVPSSTELFANTIFGKQSTDIRTVRWEYSLLPANTISSWDCMPTSQLASSWPGAPWITVTGVEFKDPFETGNINNTLGLPGLPVYTWSDYIGLLNTHNVGTPITLNMSSGQVGSIIQNYMGWNSISFGITWRRCLCNPYTTSCNCIDPGDGSGAYSSLHKCKTNQFSCCGALPSITTPTPILQKVGLFNTVEFPYKDVSSGFKEAKSKGFKGTIEDILSISDKLINDDGTINDPDKHFLSCKKCGSGIGGCAGGSCIGVSCCPPKIILTIPI